VIVEQQINQKQIKILVYNEQNTPGNVQSLINKAKANGIPIVTITETLSPSNATYQDWQSRQLQNIANALKETTGK
jgi:zinc/manganese transport system substrate-binding protein